MTTPGISVWIIQSIRHSGKQSNVVWYTQQLGGGTAALVAYYGAIQDLADRP
jgi:hypothetical protein